MSLLREWEELCKRFSLLGNKKSYSRSSNANLSEDDEDELDVPKGEFEVGKLVGICFGDPHETGKHGLKFKVIHCLAG